MATPRGSATNYHVDYGTSSSYGRSTPEHRACNQPCHSTQQIGGKFTAQAVRDQMRGAFHGLERNVAGETIGNNDVHLA